MSEKFPAVRSLPVKDSLDSTWNAQRVLPKSRRAFLSASVVCQWNRWRRVRTRGPDADHDGRKPESPTQTRHMVSKRHTRQRLNNNVWLFPGWSQRLHVATGIASWCLLMSRWGRRRRGNVLTPPCLRFRCTPRLTMDGICGSPGTEVRSLVCVCGVLSTRLYPARLRYLYPSYPNSSSKDGLGSYPTWHRLEYLTCTCYRNPPLLPRPHHPAFFLCRDTSII